MSLDQPGKRRGHLGSDCAPIVGGELGIERNQECLSHHRIHIGPRLLDGHVGLQPPDQQQSGVVHALQKVAAGHELWLHHHRRPQIGPVSHNLAKERGWSDPDDREWIIVQPYLSAND